MDVKQKGAFVQIQEKGSDTITTWEGNIGNVNPEPEIAENANMQNEWNSNELDSNYLNWRSGNNYWSETQGWGQNPGPPAKGGAVSLKETESKSGRYHAKDRPSM